MRQTKDLKKLIRTLAAQGWEVELSKNCHYKFRSPTGELVVEASSPSDNWRGRRNTIARLRRAGAKL